ncbi:growth arrest and DNA damage-inducible protein GADD45 beta-like [Mytilus californianus]|uniref:growth arrest and DNA damage-inducible protein GADD45 beta-like n=1 Tax=Mytilus californianus TaxID=6549 RepID=UPI0022482B64|nr:growth arrest and DNA damage-inducible protein GADD45 beta-like [Mytilus californianus]
MTFSEDIAVFMESQRNVNNIGFALKKLLVKAQEDGRIVVGVYECAQILQNSPETVRLCLLPEMAETDVTVQIHHKLVEAFCWENDIEVVKVDSLKKMEKVLIGEEVEGNGIECVLIQNAKTDGSADEFINNYYSMLANQSPVIDLPE